MRNSDRWVTPGVVVAVILTAGTIVLAVTAALVYLVSIGRDPEPVLSMLAQVVGVVTGPLMVALQLANRATVAKTERNTGVLAQTVDDALYGAHAAPPSVYERGAAPAGAGRLPA